MAEHLMNSAAWRRAWPCLALLAVPPVWAQELADPTRPPPLTAAAAATAAPKAAGPLLQSVLTSANRKQAIISGQLVTVGSRLGEAQVVQIRDDSVVLRNKKGLQTLKLFPGMETISATANRADSARSAPRKLDFEKKQ